MKTITYRETKSGVVMREEFPPSEYDMVGKPLPLRFLVDTVELWALEFTLNARYEQGFEMVKIIETTSACNVLPDIPSSDPGVHYTMVDQVVIIWKNTKLADSYDGDDYGD